MNRNIELTEALKELKKGSHYINLSISYATEEGKTVCEILNSDTYTNDRYFWKQSLDEEMLSFITFCNAFLNETKDNIVLKNDLQAVDSMVYGLNSFARGMGKVVNLCRNNNELRSELLNYKITDPDYAWDEEDGYNPFKLYGIIEFDKKFRGWRRAYISNLRGVFGNKKIKQAEAIA